MSEALQIDTSKSDARERRSPLFAIPDLPDDAPECWSDRPHPLGLTSHPDWPEVRARKQALRGAARTARNQAAIRPASDGWIAVGAALMLAVGVVLFLARLA